MDVTKPYKFIGFAAVSTDRASSAKTRGSTSGVSGSLALGCWLGERREGSKIEALRCSSRFAAPVPPQGLGEVHGSTHVGSGR